MTGGMIQAGGKRHLEFVFGHYPPKRAFGEPRPVWWPGGPPVGPVSQPTQERRASTSGCRSQDRG
jgi:hypothetical protein